jgi:hypothetical protein
MAKFANTRRRELDKREINHPSVIISILLISIRHICCAIYDAYNTKKSLRYTIYFCTYTLYKKHEIKCAKMLRVKLANIRGINKIN